MELQRALIGPRAQTCVFSPEERRTPTSLERLTGQRASRLRHRCGSRLTTSTRLNSSLNNVRSSM